MKTHIRAIRCFTHTLPSNLQHADIRLSEQVLDQLIEEYSDVGDIVFDPFAGFGTTLISAERLDRTGYGVEQNLELCAYARRHLRDPSSLHTGDIRIYEIANLPEFNLCISSPIYMHQHENRDPLTGFIGEGTYDQYLHDLAEVYWRVGNRLKSDGHLIIEAANLKSSFGVTRFAWDLAERVSEKLPYQGEIVLNWDSYGAGYDHSYCLLFRSPEG